MTRSWQRSGKLFAMQRWRNRWERWRWWHLWECCFLWRRWIVPGLFFEWSVQSSCGDEDAFRCWRLLQRHWLRTQGSCKYRRKLDCELVSAAKCMRLVATLHLVLPWTDGLSKDRKIKKILRYISLSSCICTSVLNIKIIMSTKAVISLIYFISFCLDFERKDGRTLT